MTYRKLIYEGDIRQWFAEIMSTDESLLLCSGPEVAENSSPEPEMKERAIGLYTSASTGQSKCIWNTYERLMFNAQITAREFEVTESDTLLMMAKPWHVAGLSWVFMAEQVNANYSFIPTKKGGVQRWYRAIREVRPTYVLTVPAVLRRLCAYENWQVPKVVFGGAPMAAEDYEPLAKHCSTIYQGYGQTEAGGLISCRKMRLDGALADENLASNYGQPPEEFELRCDGTTGGPASVWLKSSTAIYRGFYDTGDLGYLEKDGALVLQGRSDA